MIGVSSIGTFLGIEKWVLDESLSRQYITTRSLGWLRARSDEGIPACVVSSVRTTWYSSGGEIALAWLPCIGGFSLFQAQMLFVPGLLGVVEGFMALQF
jgi:hypothetical protein